MPYFILDLLQQTPAVFVHGLGRFEAIFHPAVIDLPADKIKPPYIEPDFQYDLDSPSDILPRYIAYATGNQLDVAKDAIAAFVRKVHELTENGMMYPIEKFGTFSRSGTGQIRFTPDWDAFNLSFSGLETISLSTPRATSPTAQTYVTLPPVESWTAPEIKEEPIPVIESEQKEKEPEVIESKVHSETEATHQDRVDESTTRLWWIILTTAIVLIAVMCAYLAWDIISNRNKLNELRRIYPDTTATTIIQDSILAPDSIQPITDGEDNQDTAATSEDPKPTSTPEVSSPCFVVVGAFSSAENIKRMSDRLQSLGHTVEEIRGGTLTRVAIRTSCEPSNLQQVLNDARSSINPEAWIY